MPHKNPEQRKNYHKQYYQSKKKELDEYRTAYRKANPEKEKGWQKTYVEGSVEKRKSYVLKSRYNLTIENLQELLVSQNHACAICQQPFGCKRPQVDHCHETGRVRGVLCVSCNTTLGIMGDTKDEITKKYLKMMEYLN